MIRFQSFDEMLTYYAVQLPNETAFIYEEEKSHEKVSCTYQQLYKLITIRAHELKTLHKSCIGVLADGSFSCVVSIFAANMAGMQIVMLDPCLPDAVLKEQITVTDVDYLYGDEELTNELKDSLTNGVNDGSDRILFFTSGTTSMAKAVSLTGYSLCQSAHNGGCMLPLCADDILLCMLPLSHVFGFVCGLLWGLSFGAAIALGRGARHYLEDPDFFQPTTISAVASLLNFLLLHHGLNTKLKRMLVGAGDCPAELFASVKEKHIHVSYGYGLTETSSGVAISIGENPYAMEICPDNKITIAQDGEILIYAPTCMMSGYYKDTEATRLVLKDELLYTGDLGYFDENGKLHVSGRKKEILVLNDGTKIFLPEYEHKIAEMLNSIDIAVTLKDDKPCLVFCGQAEKNHLWEELKPIMDSYPRSQQLADIIMTNMPIPRTATGKVKRFELDQMLKQISQEGAL